MFQSVLPILLVDPISSQWLDKLIYQGWIVRITVSQITWINGSLIHVSKQIATQKSQTQRIKALALTLGFPDRWHYFTVSNLVRFWYTFQWKCQVSGSLSLSAMESIKTIFIFHYIRVIIIKKGNLSLSHLQNWKFLANVQKIIWFYPIYQQCKNILSKVLKVSDCPSDIQVIPVEINLQNLKMVGCGNIYTTSVQELFYNRIN